MCRLCAKTMPSNFLLTNLSILGPEHPWGILETVPCGFQGTNMHLSKPVEYTSPRMNPW